MTRRCIFDISLCDNSFHQSTRGGVLSPLLFKIFTADALAVFLRQMQQLQQLQQLQHLQQLQQYLSANEENESSARLKELGDMFRPEQQRKRSYEIDIAHTPELQGLQKRRALYRAPKERALQELWPPLSRL